MYNCPDSQSPHILWPQTEWNNISRNYSGLFFRAEGGGAASFDQIQSEQTRSLQILNGESTDVNPGGCEKYHFTKKPLYCDGSVL